MALGVSMAAAAAIGLAAGHIIERQRQRSLIDAAKARLCDLLAVVLASCGGLVMFLWWTDAF